MPVTVRKIGGIWRVVEPGGKIANNAAGTPVDGKGHADRAMAVMQARAINAHKGDMPKHGMMEKQKGR